jgi:hypothetical protein
VSDASPTRPAHAAAVRALLVVPVAALLAWVPLHKHYTSDLTWYWAISWDHGFVRRGLCGELAGLLPTSDLELAAQLMTGLTASVAIATVVTVALLRLLRGDPVSVVLGGGLVLGPVGPVMLWFDPRPEYLGFPALLFVMAACHARAHGRPVASGCWLALASALLGVVTLASETVLFAVVPWCVVLLAAATAGAPVSERLRLLAGLVFIPGCAALAVLVAGRADAAQLAALGARADQLDGKPSGFMLFIGQDVTQSVRMVFGPGIGFRLGTMLVAAAIVALLVVLLVVCGAGREWSRVPADRLLRLSLCMPVAALVFETATGIDWPRWVGQLGCGGLLTLTAWGFLVPDRDPLPWSVPRLGRMAVCLCLLLLVPEVPYGLVQGTVTEFVASRVA